MEFEAWLHSEMGLTYMEIAQYTPREVARLNRGWNHMKEKEQRRANSTGSGADPARQSKVRREQAAMDKINSQMED